MKARLLERIFRRASDHDAGFVMVWICTVIFVLLGFAGLAVDLGNWYLHIERTQRAADSAALAGAPFLPDNPEEAINAATVSLRSNGMATDKVTYAGPSSTHPNFMVVTLRGSVESAFLNVFGLNVFNFRRTGLAADRPPVPMGSPDNVLGEEPSSMGSWSTSGVPRGYWLSQATQGREKQFHDRWDTMTCRSWNDDFCTGTTNDEYTPGGRPYVIDVSPGVSGWLAVEVYDPTLWTSGCSGTCPGDLYLAGAPPVTTIEIRTPATSTGGTQTVSTAGCQPRAFPADDPSSMAQWVRVCSLFIDGSAQRTGRYTIVIDMPGSSTVDASNVYSIRAAILTGSATGPVDPVLTSKVYLYGPGRMVTQHAAAAVSQYYIAKLPTRTAGSRITVQLYDFGEYGADHLKFYWGDTLVEPAGCQFELRSLAISLSPTNGQCYFDTSTSFSSFYSRVTEVTVPIPADYSCDTASTSIEACWLKMEVSYDVEGSTKSEGASIAVTGLGAPLRLYNSES